MQLEDREFCILLVINKQKGKDVFILLIKQLKIQYPEIVLEPWKDNTLIATHYHMFVFLPRKFMQLYEAIDDQVLINTNQVTSDHC